MNQAHDDLTARMVPSPEQVANATADLAAADGFEFAIVPIAFPGKQYGFWSVGENVEHPAGVWLANNDESYHVATNAAATQAAKHLGERPGTVGYVIVRADHSCAVFEDIRPPLRLLADAADPRPIFT